MILTILPKDIWSIILNKCSDTRRQDYLNLLLTNKSNYKMLIKLREQLRNNWRQWFTNYDLGTTFQGYSPSFHDGICLTTIGGCNQPIDESFYVDNKLHGVRKQWTSYQSDQSRMIYCIEHYQFGKKVGTQKYYDSGLGQLLKIENYNYNGQKHGRCWERSPLDNSIYTRYYNNDKLHGKLTVWNISGGFYSEITNYVEGNWYGEHIKRYTTEPGRKKIQLKCNYKNNVLHGLCEKFHPSGKLASRRFYNNGQVHGKFKSWNERGFVIEEGEMYHDKPHGIIIQRYAADGSIKFRGEFDQGREVGIHQFYDRHGRLSQELNYDSEIK